MKKTIIYGLSVLSLSLFIFFSCRKSGSGKEVPEPGNEGSITATVTYERNEAVDVEPSIFGDHITLIETIPFANIILRRYRAHPDWIRFVSQNIDVNGAVRRYTVDHSPAQIIEVPLRTTKKCEAALIYTTKDTCLFIRGALDSLVNGNISFSYQSLDRNTTYYKFEVNDQNKIGNFIAASDIPFESIWSAFGTRSAGPTCQQQFPKNWNKCMNCAYAECSSSWLCALACSMTPGIALGCASTFALHCANIGNPK
ncbi:MAG: hypothetical protein WCF67_01175 [Chitinophagaceae bacterium]